VQSVVVLASGQPQSLRLAWQVPLGSANMEIDPLSAVFAAAILIGLVNGISIVRLGVHPIIATLSLQFIVAGIARLPGRSPAARSPKSSSMP
jgi:ribose transport system permease protein